MEWCLMTQKIINSLTTIIFPLAPWATIEGPSNSPPTFQIATGGWATAKRTPCPLLEVKSAEKTCGLYTGKDGIQIAKK